MSEFTTDHDLQAYKDMACEYECHYTKEYGFVPEDGCPVHDKKIMTKDELIRDLCSVEFRTKSKTRELVDRFIEETPYNVSEWARVGKERGYWNYFKEEVLNEYE